MPRHPGRAINEEYTGARRRHMRLPRTILSVTRNRNATARAEPPAT
jgi:hypothetical protein